MRTFVVLISALSLSTACAPDDSDPAADAGPPVDAGRPLNALPAIADLEGETWREIEPGGDTICSRGQPWAFFFRPGVSNNLVVEFQGGGACWNDLTCSVADMIFKDNIDDVRNVVLGDPCTQDSDCAGDNGQCLESGRCRRDDPEQGIYDHSNEKNPFAGWNHLFIPYCTGDIHWGRSVVEYGTGADSFPLNHQGAVNAEVALRWAKENIPQPETVFIGGCSAGAYGSIGWAPHVMRDYPDSKVIQMGDCGAGIITDTFLSDSFPIWNALDTLPAWIDALDPATIDINTMELKDLYAEVGKYYGQHTVSQYNTVFDNNQVFYYNTMGGQGGEEQWSLKMRDQIYRISQDASNFRSYIAPGDEHCIVHRDSFYTVDSNGDGSGTLLVDWIQEMVDGETPESVSCDGCEPALKP